MEKKKDDKKEEKKEKKPGKHFLVFSLFVFC
jgi:hypothetical protein